MAATQVMVVEDESIISKHIQGTLKNLGYDIAGVAFSGKEAIEKAEEKHPDLILMDIVLRGDLDGIETAEKIHACFDIPIIYLTACNDEKTLDRAKITEPYGYVLKPFQERDLHTTIEMALYKYRMEMKLKEKERWLATTLRSIGDAVIATDAEEKISYMNPVAQALTEWNRESAMGKPLGEVFTLVDEDTHGKLEHPISRVIRDRQAIESQNQTFLITRTGKELPIDDKAAPLEDEKGNLIGAVMVFRDITDRKKSERILRKSHEKLEKKVEERTAELVKANEVLRAEVNERIKAEEALRVSEAKFRVLTETAATGIFIFQGDRFRYVNPAFEKQTGYSFEELSEISFWDIVHPDFRQLTRDRGLARQNGDSVPNRYEFKFVTKWGEEKWADFTAGIIDFEGKPAVLGTAFDITERKQAELALLNAAQQWRNTFDGIHDIVCLLDTKGKILKCNKALSRFLGKPLSEMINQPYEEIIYKTAGPIKECPVVRMRQTGCRETTILPVNDRWFNISADPLTDEAGALTGTVYIMSDITDHRKAEEEKRVLQEQLRQSQKMEAIGNLAGGVAHDFNNLLTVIGGYSDMVLDALDPNNPLHEETLEIKNASEKAETLTRQLLAFSRKQVLQPKILDPNFLVANMQKMLGRLIGENIELVTQLEKDLWEIKADPGQIEQVIVNLAVNARDAMPKGGKLTIETNNVRADEEFKRTHFHLPPGRYVVLSVRDTGVGMSQEILEHIFEPFFTTKEQGKGTGLGLSTVYGIVKQSEGNIFVQSQPGRGTTFEIFLPMVEEEAESIRPEEGLQKSSRGAEVVLVVEDEEIVRRVAVTILQKKGYHVLHATNAEEALGLAQEQYGKPIHLMLSDVVMPGISGTELAKHLTPLHPETKVLFMSGYTDHSIIYNEILKFGLPYLQKPFSSEVLARKVREVLDGQ